MGGPLTPRERALIARAVVATLDLLLASGYVVTSPGEDGNSYWDDTADVRLGDAGAERLRALRAEADVELGGSQ